MWASKASAWAKPRCRPAVAYAKERKQGSAIPAEGLRPIIRHPDVQPHRCSPWRQRAGRARDLLCLRRRGRSCRTPSNDAAIRKAAKAREDLLTPLAKAWSTDRGVDVDQALACRSTAAWAS
jgi:alkylation response protein AidB-like acyl-CoA dehydrogenase